MSPLVVETISNSSVAGSSPKRRGDGRRCAPIAGANPSRALRELLEAEPPESCEGCMVRVSGFLA
jgi:hypothetical protein